MNDCQMAQMRPAINCYERQTRSVKQLTKRLEGGTTVAER